MQQQRDSAAGSVDAACTCCILRALGAGTGSAAPRCPCAGTLSGSLGTGLAAHGSPRQQCGICPKARGQGAGRAPTWVLSLLSSCPSLVLNGAGSILGLSGWHWPSWQEENGAAAQQWLGGGFGQERVGANDTPLPSSTPHSWGSQMVRLGAGVGAHPGQYLPRMPRAGAARVGGRAGCRGFTTALASCSSQSAAGAEPSLPVRPLRAHVRLGGCWWGQRGPGTEGWGCRRDARARSRGESPGGCRAGGSWWAPAQGSLFMPGATVQESCVASVPAPHVH